MPFFIGDTHRLAAAALCAGLLTCAGALAQGTPSPAPDDPVVAKVDGKPIHLSDLKDAVQSLPENMRALPPPALYPMLLDQMIDARALVSEAHKSGLDKDPAVQRQVTAAEDRALQTAGTEQGRWAHCHRRRCTRPLRPGCRRQARRRGSPCEAHPRR